MIDNELTFGEAFRIARANGWKQFTWRGGIFTTERADGEPVDKPASQSAPAADTGQAVAWPRLTSAMIEAACKAHFGTDNADGVDLTAADVNWSFRDAFKRMWKGAQSAYRAPDPLDAERVRELEEALRPFAECAAQIDPGEDDEEWAKFRLLIKDYRAARAALRQKGGE